MATYVVTVRRTQLASFLVSDNNEANAKAKAENRAHTDHTVNWEMSQAHTIEAHPLKVTP